MHNNAIWTDAAKILLLLLALAGFQIAWHWALTLDNPLSDTLLKWYMHYNPRNRKGLAGFPDLVFPGVVAGFIIGRLGWRWPVPFLAAFVLIAAAGVVGLLPVYAGFFDKSQLWWWPKNQSEFAFRFIRNTFQTSLVMGVACYGGQYWSIEKPGQKSAA